MAGVFACAVLASIVLYCCQHIDNLAVSGSHFGGGFSRVTAHSFSSPPWWGCVDLRLALDPHPPVGVRPPLPGPASHPHHCGGGSSGSRQPHSVGVSPVTGHAHHRGSLSLQKSAHSGGSLSPWLSYLAPPAWGCLAFASRSPPMWEFFLTALLSHHRGGGSNTGLTNPTIVGVRLYYLSKPMYPLSSKEIVSATFL